MIVTQGSYNQIKSHVMQTYIIIAYIAYFLHLPPFKCYTNQKCPNSIANLSYMIIYINQSVGYLSRVDLRWV